MAIEHSDAVAREMKRWAICWGLKVALVNATGTYAAMNLAGPRSPQVLEKLTHINLDPNVFPYLAARQGKVAGVPARLLRVGFVGELGYEIHVPAGSAMWVWDQIMEKGRNYGICPFGVEAQRLLRLEKGHLIIGQDSDGLTHPLEAGMGWAVKQDKSFLSANAVSRFFALSQPDAGWWASSFQKIILARCPKNAIS